MENKYTLFIANKNYSSWSLRSWILMKELGILFNEELLEFMEGSNWGAFRKFSPNGTVPCLHAGEVVVWDSLGIVEYLAEHHKGVWPYNLEARTWARCATAEMHSGFFALRNACTMTCGQRIELHEISDELQANIDRIDELWNQGFDRFGGEFLAGDSFTAVDAFYAPIEYRIRTYDLKLSQASMAYVKRLLALDSMKTWETEALAETWREPGHEQDALNAGVVIEDVRAK